MKNQKINLLYTVHVIAGWDTILKQGNFGQQSTKFIDNQVNWSTCSSDASPVLKQSSVIEVAIAFEALKTTLYY